MNVNIQKKRDLASLWLTGLLLSFSQVRDIKFQLQPDSKALTVLTC